MSVPSDGSYGVPEGIISSFPCTCANGEYSIVQGLDIDEAVAVPDGQSSSDLGPDSAAMLAYREHCGSR